MRGRFAASMARGGPQHDESGAANHHYAIQYVEFRGLHGSRHRHFPLSLRAAARARRVYFRTLHETVRCPFSLSRQNDAPNERSDGMKWKRVVPVLALVWAFCGLVSAPLFAQAV